MVMTSQAGRMKEKGGRIRPTMAFSSGMGSPVTPFRTRMGLPTPPHATGAVLASRHRVAAWKWGKPRPMRKEPAIATGAPPPPLPSRKAPKQNAIRMTWRRRSEETPAIDSFITWNCPVSTATL
jgi:hypothetical protein